MKGVDALIASVLIILISITAIFIAMQMGNPSVDRSKEIMLMQEGKNNLITINNAVDNVITEGEGSTRLLRLSVSSGYYSVDNITNSVSFTMESRSQIVGDGVTKVEDGINITGSSNIIYLSLHFGSIQIVSQDGFGKGQRSLVVRNEGYNATSERQMIYISTTP